MCCWHLKFLALPKQFHPRVQICQAVSNLKCVKSALFLKLNYHHFSSWWIWEENRTVRYYDNINWAVEEGWITKESMANVRHCTIDHSFHGASKRGTIIQNYIRSVVEEKSFITAGTSYCKHSFTWELLETLTDIWIQKVYLVSGQEQS